MSELPPSFRTPQWNGLFAPLNVAAYVTWLAVASGPILDWFRGNLAGNWSARVGLAALFAFPLFYVLRTLDRGEPLAVAERHGRAVILLQAMTTLIACWGLITCCGMTNSGGALPVLLIAVASQVAVCWSPRATAILLLLINVPLAALLAQRWPWNEVVSGLLAYGGFQIFAALVMNYAKRTEHARDAVLRINAELLATRQLLSEGARAEERLRLSRELHDVAGHKLTALKLQLALQSRQSSGEQARALHDCEHLAEELLTDIRGVVSTLRQHEGVDLQQALRALDPNLPRPSVSFDLDPDVRIPDMRRAEALLRCAQEGLTNALRHSAATTVRVNLKRTNEGLLLAIEDDGVGRAAQLRPGNGLRGLRERVEEAGGRLEIHNHEPMGLTLSAFLPEQAPASAPADPPPSPLEALSRLHSRYCPLVKPQAEAT
jgi:signal transduction histidine kinase